MIYSQFLLSVILITCYPTDKIKEGIIWKKEREMNKINEKFKRSMMTISIHPIEINLGERYDERKITLEFTLFVKKDFLDEESWNDLKRLFGKEEIGFDEDKNHYIFIICNSSGSFKEAVREGFEELWRLIGVIHISMLFQRRKDEDKFGN